MILRPPDSTDAQALSALAREAFVAAFGQLYAPADLARFLAEDRSCARYAAHIADPATRIMLAEEGGILLAYCLIKLGDQFADHPEPRPLRPVQLSQLYCAGHATGRGLGAALMDWAMAEARDWGADAMTLSVYSENFGAQRFYRRYGFAHVADISFWVGSHRDDEFLYQLRLDQPGT